MTRIYLQAAAITLAICTATWAAVTFSGGAQMSGGSRAGLAVVQTFEDLLMPLTAIDEDHGLSWATTYNSAMVTHLTNRWNDYPEAGTCDGGSTHFYDTALSMYQLSKRYDLKYQITQQQADADDRDTWRTRANTVANDWSACTEWTDCSGSFDDLEADPITSTMSGCGSVEAARAKGLRGLAFHNFYTSDTESLNAVKHGAMREFDTTSTPARIYSDPRETGYSLEQVVVAIGLGEAWTNAAVQVRDLLLDNQIDDGTISGYWRDIADGESTGNGQCDQTDDMVVNYDTWIEQPFMSGILMQSLIAYERIVGQEAAILAALEDGANHLWDYHYTGASTKTFNGAIGGDTGNNHDHPPGPSYSAFRCYGSLGTSGQPLLNGIIAEVFGYLYHRTSNTVWVTRGDLIMEGLVDGGLSEICCGNEAKKTNEAFRNSPRYLGWTAGAR